MEGKKGTRENGEKGKREKGKKGKGGKGKRGERGERKKRKKGKREGGRGQGRTQREKERRKRGRKEGLLTFIPTDGAFAFITLSWTAVSIFGVLLPFSDFTTGQTEKGKRGENVKDDGKDDVRKVRTDGKYGR